MAGKGGKAACEASIDRALGSDIAADFAVDISSILQHRFEGFSSVLDIVSSNKFKSMFG